MSVSIDSGSSGFMPIEGRRKSWFRNVLARYDLYYAVPVVIAVAAFIVAVLAYFR